MAQELQIKTLAVGPIRANCYLVFLPDRDDCVLIDPGAQPEKIVTALHGKKVAAVLLTHGHFDHVGAVEAVASPDIPLYIHPLDEPMLRDPEQNMAVLVGSRLSIGRSVLPAREGDVITAAGISFSVLHTPGHTPGSVCFQAGRALFTGDTMFRHGYGRTDLPGGSWEDLYQSLKRLLLLQKDCEVFPGHEAPTTIGGEQEYFQ